MLETTTAKTHPRDLATLPQWVFVKRITEGDGLQRLRAFSPLSGKEANFTGTGNWSSYEKATHANTLMGGDGIAFMLSERDPFVGVVCPIEQTVGAHILFDETDAFVEESISKKYGVVIVRGSLPNPGSWYLPNLRTGVFDRGVGIVFNIDPASVGQVSPDDKTEVLERLWESSDGIVADFDSGAAELSNWGGLCVHEPLPTKSVIELNQESLGKLTDQALTALRAANSPLKIFVSGDQLVRLDTSSASGTLLQPMTEARLRGALSRSAVFIVNQRFGPKKCIPPDYLVRDILALSPSELERWFPALDHISEIPPISADGNVCDTPGFDPKTRTLYSPPRMLPLKIPTRPTSLDVRGAVDRLAECFEDFPFSSEADRAQVYALLLTPCIRPLVAGACPITVVDAPRPGTGKSLLVEVVSEIATGRPAPMAAFTAKDDELRKRITASLTDASPFLVIDNVDHRFESASLSAASTSQVWTDRILGTSRCVSRSFQKTVILTGNNVQLAMDLRRRSCWIRLDPGVNEPWIRGGFHHKQLLKFVRQERQALLRAVFVMISAWLKAGSPPSRVSNFGSFESWNHTVGSILEFCGIVGYQAWRSPATRRCPSARRRATV